MSFGLLPKEKRTSRSVKISRVAHPFDVDFFCHARAGRVGKRGNGLPRRSVRTHGVVDREAMIAYTTAQDPAF